MRGMCFTSWHTAYEDTLPPAEIEPFDKRLAAAIEADKNYRLSSAGRRNGTLNPRTTPTFLEQTAKHPLVGVLCSVHRLSLPTLPSTFKLVVHAVFQALSRVIPKNRHNLHLR